MERIEQDETIDLQKLFAIIIAAADEAEKIKADLESRGEAVYEIGKVTQGSHEVIVKGGVFDE